MAVETYILNKEPRVPTSSEIHSFGPNPYGSPGTIILDGGISSGVFYNANGIEELDFLLPTIQDVAYIFKETVFGGTTYQKGWYKVTTTTEGTVSAITPTTPPDSVELDLTTYTIFSQTYFNELFTKGTSQILQLTPFLTSVANAIRTKEGTTAKINPQDFANKITNLPSGGGVNFDELNSKKWGSPVGYSVTLQDPDGIGGSTQYSIDNGTTWIDFPGGTTINGITDIMFKVGEGATLYSDANNLNIDVRGPYTTANYTLTKSVVVFLGFF